LPHPEVQVLVLDLPEVLAQIEPSAGLWLCEGDLRSEWTVPCLDGKAPGDLGVVQLWVNLPFPSLGYID